MVVAVVKALANPNEVRTVVDEVTSIEMTEEEIDFLQDCISYRCDDWSVLSMQSGAVTGSLVELATRVAVKLGMEVDENEKTEGYY